MLTTLATLKSYMGIESSDNTDDDMLTSIIAAVSVRLAAEAGRVHGGRAWLESERRTILFSPGARDKSLWLPTRPIVTVHSIKESLDEAFDDADALTEKTDYLIDRPLGALIRYFGLWMCGPNTVQVDVTAGFTPPNVSEAAGYVQGANEVLLPADIQFAANMQCAFVFQRRGKLGLTGEGVSGGSYSTYQRDELLPEVRQVMAQYRPAF